MTSAFTIILPHLRNTGNDAALRVCLDCLMQNTVNDFSLLMLATHGGTPLQQVINDMVAQAPDDIVVYWCSDTFAAPGWDVPMLKLVNERTFVNPVLVEPGVMGVHDQNEHKDFGRTPDTFDRAGFEEWAQSAGIRNGEGWYAPYMFPRNEWLAMGGLAVYPPEAGDFVNSDQVLFDNWKAAGNRVVRVRSFAYHLQRFSVPEIQQHESRK